MEKKFKKDIGMEEIKKGIFGKNPKKKERRGLAFRVDIELLNEIFGFIKERKYKLIPKDAQIHSISEYDRCWDGYTIIVTSREFPIVGEGSMCNSGHIKVDTKKGIIELKERE